MKITQEQLRNMVPFGGANIAKYYQPLVDTMERFGIVTPERIACFIAQLAHESGSFKYVRELASGQAYEGRKDLGNTEPGDGVRFKGRGLIQITGRTNYTTLSQTFGQDFITHPELLETPLWACMSAGWFWNTRHLNEYADKLDFLKISIRINGINRATGLPNGYDDRLKRFTLCKQVLGITTP